MPDTTPHEPTDQTRRTVESMSAFGIPQEDIARVIGVVPKTLRKHYRDELDTATAKANAKVAQSLYNKALADGQGSVTAAIFWLKTRAGWKETSAIEHMGKDGGAIQHEDVTKRDADAFTSRLLSLAAEAGSTAGIGEADAASEGEA